MPLAAEISILDTTTAHPFTLTLGGTDVIRDPGGSGFGVPIGTIRINERGPGGISAIEFDVMDPPAGYTPPDGAEIAYFNNVTGKTLFRGFLDTWSSDPDFGDQGRTMHVQGTGIETLLDWPIVKDIPLMGTDAPDFIAHAGAFYGIPRSINNYPSASESSSTAPISRLWRLGGDITPASVAAWPSVTGNGGTLREAILFLAANAANQDTGGGPAIQPMLVTVDFNGGLRVWRDEAGVIPSDYANLTVSDVGALKPEYLSHRREPGQLIRAVYVTGASAAASGLVVDGSGIRGRQAYLADATIDTAAKRDQAAARIFNDSRANIVRGEFYLYDFTPASEDVHGGSFVSVTSAAVGLAGASFRIGEIEKTFNPSGRQNWHVTYGSLAPAVTTLIRQLTRDVLR